jgi:hypothetical protein
MAKELQQSLLNKLVTVLKKKDGFGQSETFYVNATGIERSQIGRYLYQAELLADPSVKIPATTKAIVAARNQGVRWPRIAVRAGISESAAKELFEASGTAAADSYTGRGRKTFESSGATSGRRGAGSKKTGVKVTAAASGRRRGAGAKNKSQAAPASRRGRGTRSSARAGADPK